MKKQYLTEGWCLSGGTLSASVPAAVPGCVHTDLRAAELIPDMYYRDNADSLTFIENEEWLYSCSFKAKADPRARLMLEGVDTYADVYLNGVRVGECEDMFIPYSFPVGDTLAEGENLLEVRLRSPIKEVEGRPKRNGAFTTERMYTRRMQCTYSWDWVGRLVTAGIYRPVYIEYPNGIDVADVYIYTEAIDSFGAAMRAEVRFKNYEQGELCRIEAIDPDGKCVWSGEFYADRELFVRRFDVKNPRLWYPAGYGDSPLYTLRITLGENTHSQVFGIRTLRIERVADEPGSEYHILAEKMQKTRHGAVYSKNERHFGFRVIVNGRPILCKGANWVPAEPFPSAESPEKIDEALRLAREAGVNTVRVWGGGIFERGEFYDACDRLGILVIQDFLMACGEYPEDEAWFIEALRREADYAVRYLRNHPSLAWWQGDNENATEGSDTQKNYIGRESALGGIAERVYTLDPIREFLPSSPYGGNTYGSVTVGTTHTTNFLGQIFEYFDSSDCRDYKEYLGGFTARFVSEEGSFGAVCRPSLLRFMTEEDLADPKEEMLLYHTKGNPALAKEIFTYVTSFAKKALGEPCDAEDRLFKYRYAQYEWVRVAFENCKRNLGYENGIVFWMLNDCWPAALGWALIDYYNLPKASYYAFKRMAAPLTLSLTEEGGAYYAYVSADRGSRSYTLNAYTDTDSFSIKGVSPEYGSDRIPLPFPVCDGTLLLGDVVYEGGSDRSFYKKGSLPILPDNDRIEVVERTADSITVRAKGYIHALELEGEYIFSDNYFIMNEGEVRTVSLRPAYGALSDGLTLRAYILAEEKK